MLVKPVPDAQLGLTGIGMMRSTRVITDLTGHLVDDVFGGTPDRKITVARAA